MDTVRLDNKSPSGVILVLSSDNALLGSIREALETPTLQVIVPESAAETPARAKARQPDLILMDADKADAPSNDGTSLLEALKTSPYTAPVPIIAMLHPHIGEERHLDLFRRGVEDCLVLPENGELLKYRLSVLSRRFGSREVVPETLSAEGLTIDLRARKVVVNDAVVALTRKEFDLLNMLLRKRGIVAYTTHLYHSVWGYGESSPVDSHTVKVHISSLRSKLGPALGRKIVNLPGLGYRFDD